MGLSMPWRLGFDIFFSNGCFSDFYFHTRRSGPLLRAVASVKHCANDLPASARHFVSVVMAGYCALVVWPYISHGCSLYQRSGVVLS
jgi:hypothetical protein